MSGLLTRLASRATGSAPVLRADAGLAGFSGSSGGGGGGSSGGGFMAGEGDLAPAAAARAREHDWSAPAVRPGQASTPGVLPVVHQPASASTAAAAATRVTASPHLHATLAPLADATRHFAAIQRQPMVAPVSVAPWASSASRAASPSIAAPAAEGVHTDDRYDTAAFATALLPAHTGRRATPPGQTAEPGGDPAPLMGQGPRPAPLAAPTPRAGAPSPGMAAQPDPSDTEVHIHIGRIDVTAMPEAQAPRRSEPKVQAPLSLDAYLAQRGRS